MVTYRFKEGLISIGPNVGPFIKKITLPFFMRTLKITDSSLEFPYLVNECITLESLSNVVKPKLYAIYDKYVDMVFYSYSAASCKFEEEQLLNCVCACTRRFHRSDIESIFHKLYLKYTPDVCI